MTDDADNCDFVVTTSQTDADNDGAGDVCDSDDDNDDVPDGADGCPSTTAGDAALADGCSIVQE